MSPVAFPYALVDVFGSFLTDLCLYFVLFLGPPPDVPMLLLVALTIFLLKLD